MKQMEDDEAREGTVFDTDDEDWAAGTPVAAPIRRSVPSPARRIAAPHRTASSLRRAAAPADPQRARSPSLPRPPGCAGSRPTDARSPGPCRSCRGRSKFFRASCWTTARLGD